MATPVRLRTEILADPIAAWDELEAGITFLEEEIYAQDPTYTVTPFVSGQRLSTWVMTKAEIQGLEDRMHAVSDYLGIPHLLTTWSGLMPVGYNAMNHFILGLMPEKWIEDGYDIDGELYDIMPIDYNIHGIDWLSMFRGEESTDWLTDLIASLQPPPSQVFLTAAVLNLDVTAMDSTHALICCNNLEDSYHGKGVVAVINGTALTFGTVAEFVGAMSKEIKVERLNSTQAIIVYQEANSDGKAMIATISGNSVSFGSGYAFELDEAEQPAVCRLDDTHALIIYRDTDNGGYGAARIATVSGTEITFSSVFVFNAGYTYDMAVAALDSTHAIITYEDNGNDDKGAAIIATIAGGDITFGSEYLFNDAVSSYTSVTALDSTHAVIAFTDGANSNKGAAIVATVSGSDISFGTKAVYSANGSIDNCVNTIDSTHVSITYHGPGTALIGTIAGSAITFSDSSTFSSASIEESASSLLSTTALIVAFADIDNSYYGTAAIVSLD